MVLFLAACTAPVPPPANDTAEPDDTAADSGGDSGSDSGYDCTLPPDPDRGMSIIDILGRLDAQRCLTEPDIVAVEAHMAEWYAGSNLFCDTVYRMSSPDGKTFTGIGEKVIDHASVPDVIITDSGQHVVVYNDITPGRFVELLRTDPERFWRQGLLGFGGVGMSVSEGNVLVEATDVNLHLEHIQEAVDPDLGRKPDGSYHLAWFGMLVEDMVISGGPLNSKLPHKFWRSASTDLRSFTPPVVAVASREGSTGGVDPTVLDLDDGGEILFVSPLDSYALGWHSADGTVWDETKRPDVPTEVPAATPDAMRDPAGGYRFHYMKNGDFGRFDMATSTDGSAWSAGTTMILTDEGFNPSVARAPDGTWWLYYNHNEADCL